MGSARVRRESAAGWNLRKVRADSETAPKGRLTYAHRMVWRDQRLPLAFAGLALAVVFFAAVFFFMTGPSR